MGTTRTNVTVLPLGLPSPHCSHTQKVPHKSKCLILPRKRRGWLTAMVGGPVGLGAWQGGKGRKGEPRCGSADFLLCRANADVPCQLPRFSGVSSLVQRIPHTPKLPGEPSEGELPGRSAPGLSSPRLICQCPAARSSGTGRTASAAPRGHLLSVRTVPHKAVSWTRSNRTHPAAFLREEGSAGVPAGLRPWQLAVYTVWQ